MRKKWTAVVLSAAMLLSAVPVAPGTVMAADEVTGDTVEAITLEAEDYTKLNSERASKKAEVKTDSKASNGKYIGDFMVKDSISYTIDVKKAGNYRVALAVGTKNSGGKVLVNSNGFFSETGQIPNTENWQNYQDTEVTLWLEEGEQTVTVNNLNQTWNLDKLTITYVDSEKNTDELETYEERFLENRWHQERIVERDGAVQYVKNGMDDYNSSQAQWDLVPDAEGWYTIQNVSSGNYLVMTEGTQEISADVSGNESDAGKWKMGLIEGYFLIYNKKYSECAINVEHQDEYPAQVLATDDVMLHWHSGKWRLAVPVWNYKYTIGGEKIEDMPGTAVSTDGQSIVVDKNGNKKTWTLSKDLSAYPTFIAEKMPIMEAVYNLTLQESLMNINNGKYGKVFWTGSSWGKVWTRDTAMSVQYSLAWAFPEESKNSLLEKVIGAEGNPQIWEEDTGTGGSYPNSDDRIIMEIAGWEIYKSTGDKEFLEQIYNISKSTLEQDYHIAYDEKTGLFRGETCGLDHRSETYPDWMNEDKADSIVNIADSKAANTNIIFARALQIMAESGRILEKDEAEIADWEEKYESLKKSINEHFWLEDRGMYSSWEYPEWMGSPVADKVDVIGNGYALMFDIADEQQKQQIMENYPLVVYGANTVWPQKNGILANVIYHNRGVWPGWESTMMIGAKENGNLQLAEEIFKSCVRGAAMNLSNKEVIHFETGEGLKSDRQLWSVAGTLSGYYRVLFGMEYGQDGITFAPYVPEWMEGPYSLNNYKYRNAVLNMTVNGKGDTLTSISVNGEEKPLDYILPTDAEGAYEIVMTVEDSGKRSPIHLEEDSYAVCPDLPVLTENEDGTLTWEENPAYTYKLWTGTEYVDVSGGSYTPSRDLYGTYSLVAVDKNGVTSEMSKPVVISPAYTKVVYEAEEGEYEETNFESSTSGYTGTGYVVDSLDRKTDLKIQVEAPHAGRYRIGMIYNNQGDPQRNQICGIRSVYVDGKDAGTFVFPLVRYNFQQSTYVFVDLEKGTHTVEILYNKDDWYDTNMATSRGTEKNNICYDSLSMQYIPESVISEQPDMTLAKPVRGESVAKAEVTVNNPGLPYDASVVWLEGDHEAGITFDEGTAYTAVITVEAGKGCNFVEDALPEQLTIAGEKVTLEEGTAVFNEDRTVITITYTFAPTERDMTSTDMLAIVYHAYEGLDVSAYTAESAQALTDALAKAEAVLDKEASEEEERAQAASDILAAAAGLVLDTSDLSAAIAAADEAAKAANTVAQQALAQAAANKEAAEAAQATAEAAQKAAEAAQAQAAAAEKNAKKSMLTIVYNAYKDMNTSSYTEESANALRASLTVAAEVLRNEDANSAAFVQATESIMKAAADLVADTSDLEAAAEAAQAAAEAAQQVADQAKAQAAANKQAAELAAQAAAEADRKAAAAEQAAAEAKAELERAQQEAAAQKAELERLKEQAEAAQKAAEEARKKAEAAEKAALEAKAQFEEMQKQLGTADKPEDNQPIQAGKTYDNGNYFYKVTDTEKLTAEVTGIKNDKLTKITVYNTVVLGGRSYRITAVAAGAFKGNMKAASAVIGKNVETIGDGAFEGCTKLKKVTMNGTKLTQIGEKAFAGCKKLKNITIKSKGLKKAGKNAFKGIYKKAVIKVPAAKYKTYRKLLAKKGQSTGVKIKK